MQLQNICSFFYKQYHIIFLFFLFSGSFVALSPLLKEGFAYGVDNTPHYIFTVRFAEMIRNGNFHLWDPDPSMGFPMLYYYQPIPYMFTPALYLLLPFIDSLFLYKLLVIILFSLFPIFAYLGMKWMNMPKNVCLLAAFFSISIENQYSFGFEISSFLFWGLYSMQYGMLLYPITVGYIYREYFGQRRIFIPVLLLSATMLCHSFVGIAANLSIALLFFLSSRELSFNQKLLDRKWHDFLYLTKIFLLQFLLVSFWIIPLITSLEYYGGNPFEGAETMQGFGFEKIINTLISGALFDAGRIPFFTFFFFMGIICCFISILMPKKETINLTVPWLIKKRIAFFLLLNIALFFLFVVGPAGFSILKYFPGFGIIHFSRFWSGFHLFGIFLAAIGFYFLFYCLSCLVTLFHEITMIKKNERDERYEKRYEKKAKIGRIEIEKIEIGKKITLFIMFCIFLGIIFYVGTERFEIFKERAKVFDLKTNDPAYFEILQVLQKLPNGRVLAIPTTGIRTHFRIYSPQLYAQKPTTLTYAVGTQDSLGYYYVEYFKTKPEVLDLFNTKYIIATNDKNYSFFGMPIHKNNNYTLYQTNASGYFSFIQTKMAIFADNKNARPYIVEWIESNMFDNNDFLTIGTEKTKEYFMEQQYQKILIPNEKEDTMEILSQDIKTQKYEQIFFSLSDFNFSLYIKENSENNESENTKVNCGSIISEQIFDGEYSAEINVNASNITSCFLMLKVNAHKDWKATVDGEKIAWIQVSPDFMAIPVETGKHTVTFKFHVNLFRIILFILSFALVFGLYSLEREKVRKNEGK